MKILVVEVLSEKEDMCDNHKSDFSCSVTNEAVVTNLSSYPDNDLSQGEETKNEILLSVDEISDLLAHDFKRYANQSKDACVLTRYAFPCNEVVSPKYDVEEGTVSEYDMPGLGGVCDHNLYINAHNDFYVENENRGVRSVVDSLFSCCHETEINSDSSYDDIRNTSEVVYPSELFEKDFDTDQYILGTQIHDNFYDLGSNHLLECEEDAAYVQSDLWGTDVANKEKSDSTYSS